MQRFVEVDFILAEAKNVFSDMGDYRWLEAILKRDDAPSVQIADEQPQTDCPCNTCANKGDYDGECQNCVADSVPIRWKTPSHYKPKQTDCAWK